MSTEPLLAPRTVLAPGTADLLWLGDPHASDPALVGGKAANLSFLAERFPVPPGFALTTTGEPLDRQARDLARQAYRRLGRLTGDAEPVVAVRSSAVDEDGADASFAGMHESYLGIAGEDQMLFAITRCLASFHSERALDYRRGRGLPETPERVAVLVQLLVNADASGVVFSANPVTRDRGEVVVNASFGLGESIVGGTVTPDSYVVDGQALQMLHRRVEHKAAMTVAAPGGTREVAVPGRLSRLPALVDEQALAAAALALDLERVMGWPVDIEVAWSGDRLFLLQCRPITTL